MNYQTKLETNKASIDAYRRSMSDSDPNALGVEAARNIKGYEAIFDPDTAVAKLGEMVVQDAEDALNPQHQPDYEALEGSRYDFLDEVTANPDHTIADALAAKRASEASITDNNDGTHTLSWESIPEVTMDDSGREIDNSNS